MVEPHGPEAGSLQTTAMDIVEPQRPATGSIIPTATDYTATWWRAEISTACGLRPDV